MPRVEPFALIQQVASVVIRESTVAWRQVLCARRRIPAPRPRRDAAAGGGAVEPGAEVARRLAAAHADPVPRKRYKTDRVPEHGDPLHEDAQNNNKKEQEEDTDTESEENEISDQAEVCGLCLGKRLSL